jgi:metal-responsive CopG/Arc/MetJ family transcriptional regulator
VGRPPLGEDALVVYALRMTRDLMRRVRAYMGREGITSRSAAIRQLLDEALTRAERRARREESHNVRG